MAKQLNIDVNLNTAKASAQLKALQAQLSEAITSASSKGALTREIVQATEAATKLKAVLNASMNSQGNLDLSKFSQNLTKSGTNLTGYAKQLNNLGTAGQQAFASMAKQIVTAQAPIREVGTLSSKLFTTLKNTARWQLSSAVLHQIVGSFQSAMSYAHGLDESLNSIRIVTGLSADEMNRFAKSANESAKALSASTLDYTDAALIYYQQGIRDQEQIKERTDATIKMANVTGDSAAKVSNQLTAIWNNFDKGGQNLEYYADVLTALGAATASSTSEISAGLEKFASIAEETGLSYEYATSSLATIVATTRQSADVVGTALKTIFGRVQSLNLGETLDDGTTLGKYSQALEKVGINIKDQNGQLKDMDIIIDEMGHKWKDLDRDQRVALAQSVAGARQYNQLMALMENYDFFKENVAIARGSTGELQKQADIYAESWEAARTRVKAASQGIIDDLIDDTFFVKLNDGFAGLLSGVDKFIDSIGGLPGVLGLIGTLSTKIFANQLTHGIERAIQSVKVFTGIAGKEAASVREQTVVAMNSITPPKDSPKSAILEANYMKTGIHLANEYQLKLEQIAKAGGTVSNIDREHITMLQEIANLYSQIAVEAQKEVEASEASLLNLQQRIVGEAETNNLKKNRGLTSGEAVIAAQNAGNQAIKTTDAFLIQHGQALSGTEGLKTALKGYNISDYQQKGIDFLLRRNVSEAQQRLAEVQTSGTKIGSQIKIRSTKGGSILSTDEINKYLMTAEGRKALSGMYFEGLKNAGYSTNAAGKQSAVFDMAKQREENLKVAEKELEAAKTMRSYGKDIKFHGEAIKQRDEALKKQSSGKELSSTEQAWIKRGDFAEARLKEMQKAINGTKMAKDFETQLRQNLKGSHFVEDLISGSKNRVKQDANANLQYQNANEQNQILQQNISKLQKESFSGLTKGISTAASGVASLSLGLSSLKSAIDAINDSSMSFGEKFLSVSMSMGMGISMLISGITSLGGAFTAIGASIKGFVGAQLMSTVGFSAEEVAAMSLSDQIGYLGLAKLEETGASASATAGEMAHAGAMTFATAAAHRLGAALKSMLVIYGPWIAMIAGVVAVVAAIKKVTAEAQEMTPEGQLEMAQTRVDEMKTSLEQTKTAAENLKSSFDNYNSITDNLKGCIKGTQEWTEALRENNNEVINLLAQYPELAKIDGAIKKDKDGVLSISKEAQEELIKQGEQNVRNAEWAVAQASQEVVERQNQIKQRDLVKDWHDKLFKVEKEKIEPKREKLPDFRQERLEISKEQPKITKDSVGLTQVEEFLKDAYWVSDDIKQAVANSQVGQVWQNFLKPLPGQLAELATSFFPTMKMAFSQFGDFAEQTLLAPLRGTENDVDNWGTFTRNLDKWIMQDIPASLEIQNAREDLHNIEAEPDSLNTRYYDAFGIKDTSQYRESYQERRMGGTAGFLEEGKDVKSKGLDLIADHWSDLMGLSAQELAPALDSIFKDSGMSLIDSSTWAKELTSNKDLRQALNENAASAIAAQTAQAAQEASTINEELIAQGYSKTDAETISNMLGQQGKLSELTEQETRNKNNELRKKDTNALTLAREYIESIGGGTFQEWTKEGISYKDASGADQTATWEMMSSALGAAAALEQLGTSASSAAQFLATLDSGEVSDETAAGVQEFLENSNFLGMKPEELVKQAGQTAESISEELKKIYDEDEFKEITGKTIDEFAQEMEQVSKGNLQSWHETLESMTDAQKEQMQGLNKYQEMSTGELIDYYNRHFKDQELITLPDLGADVESYESLATKVSDIREKWDAVGNSIQNGTHLTQDMRDLFEALNINQGDWGQFVDGDLITDAEGLIQCLNEATNSTRDLIEHARQMDMITYDNLTEDLINLVNNTDDATRATDAFGQSLEHILSQMDGLELSMAKYQQLQETLSGSTSLFDQFDKAKTADAAADWSDEWASAIKDINELVSKGDYGGQAWKTGQQLLLPERLQGASAVDTQNYINSLSKRGFVTNDGKGNYDVTWDNAVNFANAALNTKLENGNTVFSGSLSEGFKLDSSIKSLKDLAAAMDLSETSATALFSRLALVAHDGDSLWTQLAENAGDYGTQILTAEEGIATLGEKLNEARKAGNWEEYDKIKTQIQEAGAEVDKLKQKANQKVEFQLGLKEELQEAETEVEKTTAEYERLKALAEKDPNNQGLQQSLEKARQEMEAAKQKWKELTGQIEDMSEFEIKIHLEKAYSQLQKLKETIKEVQNDTVINGQHQRNEQVASKNIVDQYGHKIVTKKGLEDYSKVVEQKINVTVEATGSEQVYADIKQRYAEAKGEVEGNPADIKANNTKALTAIAKAKAMAQAFASGVYNASLTATDNTGSAIATATAKLMAFKALANSILNGDGGGFAGSARVLGSARAFGSAFDRGSWGIKNNVKNALVGELGQELVVDPQTGRYYTVGDSGAEFVDIPKGAIIFNHRQTEGLLKNRRINTRGQAYLEGSAFAGWPTIEAPPGKTLPEVSTKTSTVTPTTTTTTTTTTTKPKGGVVTAADGEILTYEEQLLNIIRDEVDEYANLERSITRLEHAYKNFTRNNDRLWGKALLENIQKSINQGKKLYEAEYAKLEKRRDDYAKSTARLNSTNELQYQQKVLVGGTYNKDAKYNTQLITFQDFKGMDFLTGLGLLDESALQRGANGEVAGVNDVVAVDRAIEEYLRQKGIEANALRTSKPGEEGEVAAENLMNNANAIAELLNKLLKEYTQSEADMLQQEEDTQDILEEIHDLAAQKITQEMEMRIQLQDNEKKLIDFAVKRIGDNPFRQAEKFLKQFSPSLFEDIPLRENGVIGTLIKKMDASVDAWNKANDQLALGEKNSQDENAIAIANWQDITQKSFDEIMSDLGELVDFIDEMAEAFSKTAELGMAEIEKYTGRMEHTVSVLDHMGKLLDLTGRKYDYASKKTIIEGSMHNLKNALDEAEHWADLMTKQREASEEEYQSLLATDAEGAEWYKQNVLDKSYELEQDALEKMYSAAEDYMTKVEELWSVGIEEIMSNWEENVTNGDGWDFLSDSMSRAKSIQDEYLTTTNKLYETNTLMRKVQSNIDKTDSKISKEKLASFNKEIEAAQQKNQLSVVEMEILKARYELLEAQLALEEARDAKSVVRLQRDNEGNYGYVYTADQDDIDEKEQEVADKENDLYNLVLGYQNENQEKRLQIQREYADAAQQLWTDYHDKHLMDTDEYNRKLSELQSQCSAKLLAIDNNLAQSEYWLNQVAAEGVSESWAYSYDDRIASTQEYMNEFTNANKKSEELILRIDNIRDETTERAKLGLKDVSEKTNELTTKNDALAKQASITSDAVASEMRAVDGLTASLAAQYTQLQNVITAMYQYAQAMQAAMKAKGPEEAESPGGDEDLSHSYFIARGEGDMDTANQKASVRVVKYTTTGMERYNADKDGGYLTENEGMIAVGDIALDKLGLTGEQASAVYHKVSLEAARRGENFSEYSGTQQRAEVTHAAHELGYTQQDAHFKRLDGYGFASGGYTGEWGSEGKLAMLHEKELVLNKDDTSNFLKALEVAKVNYEQMVQLQDLQSQYKMALFDSISNNMNAMFNKSSDTLQQEVTIHAEFPNATNHSEIEEAFSNLVNRAAQYASQTGWAKSYDNTFR